MKNLLLIAVVVALFLPLFHALTIHRVDSNRELTKKDAEHPQPKKRFFGFLFNLVKTGVQKVVGLFRGRRSIQYNVSDSPAGSELVSEELSHEQLYKLLRDNSVSLAEFYTRPLDADANPEVVKAQGGKQFGVLTTLNEGNHVLLTAGDRKGQGQDVVNLSIATEDSMTEDGWKKIWTKKISGATLGDFVEAGLEDVDSLPGSR